MQIVGLQNSIVTKYKVHLKNLSLYLLAPIITALTKLVMNPFLAMHLSYEDYAIIGYFSSFSTLFLPLMNFSIVTYYLTNYYLFPEDKREKITNSIIIAILGIGMISAAIILVAFYYYFILNNVNFPFWPFAFFIVFQIFFNNFLSLLQIKFRIFFRRF